MSVEGRADLSTAVKVRSPCLRLYIAAAITINTTAIGEIRTCVLRRSRTRQPLGYRHLSCFFVYSVRDNSVVVTTRPVKSTASNLPIILVLSSGRWMNTFLTFEYRNNPNFIDIAPRNHLTV